MPLKCGLRQAKTGNAAPGSISFATNGREGVSGDAPYN